MDRVEIVDPRASWRDVFSGFTAKWLLGFKMDKLVKEAGSQSTFKMPLSCPKNGEGVIYLIIQAVKAPRGFF